MGRHGMKYCLLCNPFGNGTTGDEDTEAIGRYFNPSGPGILQTGWIPVCEWCCTDPNLAGVEPIPGKENHPYWIKKREVQENERAEEQRKVDLLTKGPYKHIWIKHNLVTMAGGYDLWRCEKCGAEYYRRGLADAAPDSGCSVQDVGP